MSLFHIVQCYAPSYVDSEGHENQFGIYTVLVMKIKNVYYPSKIKKDIRVFSLSDADRT